MKEIDKLKRWADKQGWFCLREGEALGCHWGYIRYLLPDGTAVELRFDAWGCLEGEVTCV